MWSSVVRIAGVFPPIMKDGLTLLSDLDIGTSQARSWTFYSIMDYN